MLFLFYSGNALIHNRVPESPSRGYLPEIELYCSSSETIAEKLAHMLHQATEKQMLSSLL